MLRKLRYPRTELEHMSFSSPLRLQHRLPPSYSRIAFLPQNCCCCTLTQRIISAIPYKVFYHWTLGQDTPAFIRSTMYRGSAMYLQQTDPRPEGKGVEGSSKFLLLFFPSFKNWVSTSSPECSKVWVKSPEKQKWTVKRTVQRTIRSFVRRMHRREKKKFNKKGLVVFIVPRKLLKKKATRRKHLCVHACVELGVSGYPFG